MSINGQYKDHPLAAILPLMEDAEIRELSEDIARNTLRTPIVLYENKILDGRNRYRACLMVNVEPKIRQFTSGDPVAFIVSANVHRRHLTTSQRQLVAAKIADMKRGGDQTANLQSGAKTIAQAAEELHVSPRGVATAKEVLRTAPKKEIEAIEQGKKTVSRVAKETKTRAEAKAVRSEKTAQRLDKTGYAIPESILEEWDRAEEFSGTLHQISKIKVALEKALEDKDPIFREVTNTTVATLSNAYGDLKRVLPYAVCLTCQGRTPKTCTTCRKRGFVSEFFYSTCIPAETKEIRSKK